MNIHLRLKPSHALITLLLFSAIGLYSCGKDADPSVIKVSSTPISGLTPTTPSTGTGSGTGSGSGSSAGTGSTTINSNGDGGVAIGDVGTIIFTLKGTKYTLTTSGTNYLVTGLSIKFSGFWVTTIAGAASTATSDTQFTLVCSAPFAGIYDITSGNITLADGTSYSIQATPTGKINFNTYTNYGFSLTSKGTFDMLLVNNKSATDIQRVSGSYNVQ